MMEPLRRWLLPAIEPGYSSGNLRKPLGTRAARPHLLEKCGHDARVPSKKRGFRRLPILSIAPSDQILTARISKCVAFAGLANRGRSIAWERGRSPTDLALRNPSRLMAAYANRLLCAVFFVFIIYIIKIQLIFIFFCLFQ